MGFGTVAFFLIVLSFAVVSRVVPPRYRLFVWTLIVAGGVVPWANWTDHAHWSAIEWLPFTRDVRFRDIWLNVLFYVPVGCFYATARQASESRLMPVDAVLFGLVLSLVTETTQIFSHGRFPAMTDVLTNTTGAAVGAFIAARRAGTR